MDTDIAHEAVTELADRRRHRAQRLDADEAHRLDVALCAALRSSSPLPSLKQLAAQLDIARPRLKRAIGSVDRAVDALIDERFTAARRTVTMSSRWCAALAEWSADFVTHRLFVYRIVADVVPDASFRLSTAAQLGDLEQRLDEDLTYHLRRLKLLDDPAAVSAFVAEVRALFSIERVAQLDDGDERKLWRRLHTELNIEMESYQLFERWCDRRHDWFAAPHPVAAAS